MKGEAIGLGENVLRCLINLALSKHFYPNNLF